MTKCLKCGQDCPSIDPSKKDMCIECAKNDANAATNSATVAAVPTTEDGPVALWNPNSAANWSLVLTPAFGAYLNKLNWKNLGEFGKASTANIWFYVTLALYALILLVGVFGELAGIRVLGASAFNNGVRIFSPLYLILWENPM